MRKNFIAATLAFIMIFSLAACGNKNSQGLGMSGVDDLNDKKIGVLLGSVYDNYARKTFPDADIMQYKSQSDQIIALKTGKIDAAVYPHEAALEMLREDNELVFLGENLFQLPVGMGFSQNNDQLRESFNDFLQQIKSDGTYDDMIKRWVNDGITDMPVIENPQNNGRLVVGVVSDEGVPFALVKNNKIVGLDIEMAERFAAYLGKEMVMEDMEFSSLIAAVAGSKVDMIDSTIIITDERKEQIDFSDPYYELGTSIVALKKNVAAVEGGQAGGISKLDDLKNMRIGVLTGSAGDNAARKNFPDAQISDMNNIIDAAAALEGNKIDAVVFERTSLEGIVKDNPSLEVLAEPVELLDVAIAVKKNNPDILEPINRVITELKDNGTLDEMKKRWFVDGKLPDMPEFDSSAADGVLRVGTEALMPPFEFVGADNVVSGYDMELAERIGQALNKKVVVENMSFSALIPSLESGKIDLAISCFNVTDERKQKVDFSVPYHTSETAAMVRKEAGQDTVGFFSGIKNSFYSNIIEEDRYLLIVDGLKVTIIISLLSVILGTLLGGLICMMRMSRIGIINMIARMYISLFRGTPVLVLLMLIFYVVFASVNISAILVAIIAFGMNFAAYVSEMFRTSIESIDKGQKEAGIASGFTAFQTFIYIIMPQAVRQVLPVYKGEFISLVKMTSIVGYIAVQDLTKAGDIIRSRTFDAFFPLVMIAILYFIISWILTFILDYISKKTDPKQNRASV